MGQRRMETTILQSLHFLFLQQSFGNRRKYLQLPSSISWHFLEQFASSFVRQFASLNDFQQRYLVCIFQPQPQFFNTTNQQLQNKDRLHTREKLLKSWPVVNKKPSHSAACFAKEQYPPSFSLSNVLDALKPIIKLVFKHSHELCYRAGPEYVKTFIQQRFLTSGARSVLFSINHECSNFPHFRASNL